MSQGLSKIKTELLSREYCHQLIVDALRLFDREHTGAECNDEYYLLYVNKLKYQYSKDILPSPVVIQKDLEDEIEEVKNEVRIS